ncbi:MAG: class I SAM-dependent methyltransferase [Bacillota bacterium]
MCFGRSPQAVGFSTPEQQKRFQALIKNVDLESLRRESKVDFGCGLSHFLPWLQEKGLEKDYFGVDIMEEFLKDNRIRFPDFKFISTNDFIGTSQKYGFIFTSGVFTIPWCQNHNEEVKKCIKMLFNKCRHVFSFNMLNTHYKNKILSYYYFDPIEIGKYPYRIKPREKQSRNYTVH